MGYHKAEIKKGQFGEISKIEEELAELKDAIDQDVKLMALIEIADIYGAIEGYLTNHFPSVDMLDVIKMSNLTKKAFQDGSRV
jgi:hypothetical protein